MEYERIIICHNCNGNGYCSLNPDDIFSCIHCSGQGTILGIESKNNMISQTSKKCDECKGFGKIIKVKCKQCNGETLRKIRRKIAINLDKGVLMDMNIKFQMKGMNIRKINVSNQRI